MANSRFSLLLALALTAPLSSAAAAPGDESLDARRGRLEKMPPDELSELGRKKDRFEQLTSAKRDELRRLHTDLANDPNADKLETILGRYHRWLQTLTAAQRAELLSLPAEERVARIRKIQQEQKSEDEKRFGRPGRPVSQEDQLAILNWLDNLAKGHESELLASQAPRMREFLDQITDARRRRLVLVGNALRPRPDGTRALSPSAEELQTLLNQLSPALRKEISARPGKDGGDPVQEVVRIAMFSMWQPTPEELERFYREDLSASDQEWLDGMPRERFQRELRKLYFEHFARRGGGPDGLRGMFPGRGPGGFGEGGPRIFKGENRPGTPKNGARPGPPPP